MTFQIDANHAMARATSLVEAVKVAGGDGVEDVLKIAHHFYAYITQESTPKNPQFTGPVTATNLTPPAADGTPNTPVAAPAPAAKPAKAKPAAKPAPQLEPKPEAAVTSTTKEEVGDIVSKLLGAKLRDEAINLLKKFKATSVSGIAVADYEKFVKEGKQILGNALLSSPGEPEADLEA